MPQRSCLPAVSLALACLFFLAPGAHAQLFESQHPGTVAVPFTPAEQATLNHLDALRKLDDGPWRFHVGDLEHGESPTLDDSAWPLASAKSKAPREAVWYRRTIEIPRLHHGYDLTGVNVNFRLNAYANGPMPEILYFNGRRVALGDDLEAIQLFDNV